MTLYLYISVLYISLVVGLYLYRLLPPALRLMWYYVLCSVIVEMIGMYRIDKKLPPATDTFIIFQIFEYILVSRFFLTILHKGRTAMWITVPIVCAFNVIALFSPMKSMLKIYSFQLGGLLLSVWSILYFLQLFRFIEEEPLEQNPNFWVAVGVIFFYCGCFFIYGYATSISRYDPKLASDIYGVINHLLNCLYYGMVCHAFICHRKFRNSF